MKPIAPKLPPPPRARGGVIDAAETASWFVEIWRVLTGVIGVAWESINKAGSSLDDVESREHAMLEEVLGWENSEDGYKVRHISNADGKVWQDHVEETDGNPHGTDHDMIENIAGSGDRHITASENAEITAIDSLATGIVAKTADAAYSPRAITGTANEVDVANGNGVSGDPTIGLPEVISTPRKFGDNSNNTEFESNGFMVNNGGAVGWHDVEFPQAVPKAIGAGNPTLVTLIGGIKGYAYAIGDTNPFDPRETVHKSKIGSTATWHVHFVSMANDGTDRFIKWQLEYTPEPVSGAYLGTTTISVEVTIPAGTPVRTPVRANINTFTIDAIAVLMHCTLTRIAASGTAPSVDPIVGGTHYHFQIDTPSGSRQILSK